MKKTNRKISHDLIWEIEKIRKKEGLDNFDQTLRFIVECHKKRKV